jgi:cell division protein FtsB
MNPLEPRAQATLDAAMNLIRTAAASAAMRVADHLLVAAQNANRISERDQLIATQQELKRNLGSFQSALYEALRERVSKELAPRVDNKRRLESADWQTLSLVGEKEVEEQMNFVRLGQMISHESEWQLRDLAAYMGALLNFGSADDERNPLRAEVVGAALHIGIEAISGERESRRLLQREVGQMVAQAMPKCYEDILRLLQERGIRPVHLTVRTVEGPGNQLTGVNSGYASLPRDGISSRGGGYGEIESTSGPGSDMDLLAAHRRALATAFPNRPEPVDSIRDPGPAARSSASRARVNAAADQQLMTLLRRLTAIASQPGELDAASLLGPPPTTGRAGGGTSGGRASGYASSRYAGGGGERGTVSSRSGLGADSSRGATPLADPGAGAYGEGLTGLMAVNLIRAHREELMQASTGKLDHMVIDVVGSLFDQILSDSRVPPQMAREIARLQLPVLRVALSDQTFFSTRRHPVRRFINRIASLANAFDEFDIGPGAKFLTRVRKLVDEIVEGDFDQIELYAAKVADLEKFVADQSEGAVEKTGAAVVLDAKESELRVQQRYMLQLQGALAPLALPTYLQEFVSQVWSQALVLAVRRDGPDSDRAKRYRRVGTDLVMSIQPKGSPAFRKKFLMQLPPLMKDLNEGMRLIGWSETAQKEFFGKLLPAHAESLKGQPLSELDHNLLVKRLEGVFAMPVPMVENFARSEPLPEVAPEVIERRFTPEEAKQVGLVNEAQVDWSDDAGHRAAAAVDLDLSGDVQPPVPASPSVLAKLDPEAVEQLGPTTSESGEPGEPTRGPQLIDHIKLGFAYQMHLKDEWQKVQLAHVSSGRSFFVFTRGGRHQETISMTSRMLARMCETGRFRAVESAYLMERATVRARKQLAELSAATKH